MQFFSSQGCRMVEMTCEEHDRIAASTQFITHTGGWPGPFLTASAEALQLVP